MKSIQQGGVTSRDIQRLFLKTYRDLCTGEIVLKQARERARILRDLFKITEHIERMERLD